MKKLRLFLVSTVILLITSVISQNLCAEDQTPAAQEDNNPDSTGMMITLRTISLAAENYAIAHKEYPTKLSDLTLANPPYLGKNYCHETVWGYTYTCDFFKEGYTLTATPEGGETSGAPVLTVKTGGALESNFTPIQVQSSPDALTRYKDFFAGDELDKYKKMLEQYPQNYNLKLLIANMYAGQGDGQSAVNIAEELIKANPNPAVLKKAYQTAILGYYLIGDIDKSYERAVTVLQSDPDDPTALAFKKELEEVRALDSARNPVNFETASSTESAQTPAPLSSMVKLPTPSTPQTRESSAEAQTAASALSEETSAPAVIGSIGAQGQDDFVVLDSEKIYFSPPPGWQKAANTHSVHGDSLLLYLKEEKTSLPAISITADDFDPQAKSVVEYSNSVNKMIKKQFPNFAFTAPAEVKVNDQTAAFSGMTVKTTHDRSVWYNFHLGDKVLTVQYMNTKDQFDGDYVVFKKFIESMKIQSEAQAGEENAKRTLLKI